MQTSAPPKPGVSTPRVPDITPRDVQRILELMSRRWHQPYRSAVVPAALREPEGGAE